MKNLKQRKFRLYSRALLPCLYTAFIIGMSLLPSSSTLAQEVAESACDPDYYDTLESRAWLEAQREITQNQNLILKPDSVLEYTCFDRFMGVLAKNDDKLFTGSDRWESPNVTLGVGRPDLGGSLNSVVIEAVSSYINANFESTGVSGSDGPESYNLLAGRFDILDLGATDDDGGDDDSDNPLIFDHDPEPIDLDGNLLTDNSGTYICNVMQRVWARAKCMDFVFDDSTDGFYTFAQYRDGEQIGEGDDTVLVEDRRRYPPPACESISERWGEQIKAVYDHDETPWMEDTVVTYYSQIEPESCADLKPIPTGLVVQRQQDPEIYNEKICLSPGCVYVPSAVNEGKCCAKVNKDGECAD